MNINSTESKIMIKNIIDLFRKPSPVVLARQELEEAQRQLLQAQSATEYARRLSEYHQDRVRRLVAFLKAEHTGKEEQESEKNITRLVA